MAPSRAAGRRVATRVDLWTERPTPAAVVQVRAHECAPRTLRGPDVTSIVVQPAALLSPARRCDQAGEEMSAVGRALGAVLVDTGRCDSTAALETALDRLSEQLALLAQSAHQDAVRLRAAAADYDGAERRASGY